MSALITGKALRILVLGAALAAVPADAAEPKAAIPSGEVHAVLWTEPEDIAQRDLFYGIGGSRDAPSGKKFKFLKEDTKGSSPKFDVQDSAGTVWKVKLGIESKPETVASRLVWAVGYRTQEDYFLPEIQVSGLPAKLHRGRKLIDAEGVAHEVRLKRDADGLEKIGIWRWKDAPFAGTRALNGLRVLMSLINNWDLKDVNNGVFAVKNATPGEARRIYMVTDLGASFGTNGIGRGHLQSRGNLESYRDSRFITKVDTNGVDFATPDKATAWALAAPPHYFNRLKMRWLGRDIPPEDAKWMGRLLARLSKHQIREAFRAAGYGPEIAEAFAQVVESRIASLNAL